MCASASLLINDQSVWTVWHDRVWCNHCYNERVSEAGWFILVENVQIIFSAGRSMRSSHAGLEFKL